MWDLTVSPTAYPHSEERAMATSVPRFRKSSSSLLPAGDSLTLHMVDILTQLLLHDWQVDFDAITGFDTLRNFKRERYTFVLTADLVTRISSLGNLDLYLLDRCWLHYGHNRDRGLHLSWLHYSTSRGLPSRLVRLEVVVVWLPTR